MRPKYTTNYQMLYELKNKNGEYWVHNLEKDYEKEQIEFKCPQFLSSNERLLKFDIRKAAEYVVSQRDELDKNSLKIVLEKDAFVKKVINKKGVSMNVREWMYLQKCLPKRKVHCLVDIMIKNDKNYLNEIVLKFNSINCGEDK